MVILGLVSFYSLLCEGIAVIQNFQLHSSRFLSIKARCVSFFEAV